MAGPKGSPTRRALRPGQVTRKASKMASFMRISVVLILICINNTANAFIIGTYKFSSVAAGARNMDGLRGLKGPQLSRSSRSWCWTGDLHLSMAGDSQKNSHIRVETVQNASLGLGSVLIVLATFIYYGSGHDGKYSMRNSALVSSLLCDLCCLN